MFAFAKGRGFNIFIFFYRQNPWLVGWTEEIFRDEVAEALSTFRRTSILFFKPKDNYVFYFE